METGMNMYVDRLGSTCLLGQDCPYPFNDENSGLQMTLTIAGVRSTKQSVFIV